MTVAAILRHHRIAIDTNIFIAVEGGTASSAPARRLFDGLRSGGCEAVTSMVTLIEVASKVFERGTTQQVLETVAFVTGDGRIQVRDVNQLVALTAARLRATFLKERRRLKTPDAIQLATAIVERCELFVTSDRDFPERTIEGVQVVHLSPAK